LRAVLRTTLLGCFVAGVALALYAAVAGPAAALALVTGARGWAGHGVEVLAELVVGQPDLQDGCLDPEGADSEIGIGPAVTHFARGLDASAVKDVPWRTAREGGVAFAYIPASQGAHHADNDFSDTWRMTRKCGILRGAIHHWNPDFAADTQASNLLSQIAADPGELPPVVDVTRANFTAEASCKKTLGGLRSFSEIVEDRVGLPVVVRISPDLWQRKLACASADDSHEDQLALASQPLWIDQPGSDAPMPFGKWHSWAFWSFREDARLSGKRIPLERYRGSVADLVLWSDGLRVRARLQ